MMDKRITVDLVLVIGWLFIVLGLVHCGLAPILMQTTLSLLMPEDAHAVLYMVLATGVATIFGGTLIAFVSKSMRYGEPWAWKIGWRTAIFLLALGIGAVVAMLTNPFAHIMLGLSLILLFVLSKSSQFEKRFDSGEWPK
jgi:hypothetical protein